MTFTGHKFVGNFLMDKTAKVKKPVEAIQCANTFSLLQRKMYNVLLANAAGNLYPDVTHRITMKVLCGLMGYRSNDYKTIKHRFRELRRMDIEWDITNEHGNKVWTNTSPLSLARITEGEGICEYEFTPSLIPFLARPAQYAKFSLAIQAKFRSAYGLALYENCERYRNIGYTRSFDVPTFRKLMGVGESEYLEFFALKRRVIAVGIKEVNKLADFDIEAEYKKKGRSVSTLRFLIKNKEMADPSITTKCLTVDVSFGDKLKNYFGLKQKDIDKYLKKYGQTYIEEKVSVILNSDSFKNGLIKNMAGYLKTALIEDFQTGSSSKTIIEKHRREREAISKAQQQQEEELTELKRAYEYYLSNEVRKLIPDLADDIKIEMLSSFKKYLDPSLYLDIFNKEGLENVLIADRFVKFARHKYPEILNRVMSLEEYLKRLSAEN